MKAQVLLTKLARQYQRKQLAIPKEKIKKNIAQLKKLSSQKKVPKLTLRKEIKHLEDQLESIFDIEKALLKSTKKESTQVRSLKRQITVLKKKLAATNSKELHQRVGKLTHLLGECLAKESTREAVAGIVKEEPVAQQVVEVSREETRQKVMALQQRILLLKKEMDILKHKGKDVSGIERAIALLEDKVKNFGRLPQPRHTVTFGLNKSGVKQEPLHRPPPQKREVS